jgi:hypothetical protein
MNVFKARSPGLNSIRTEYISRTINAAGKVNPAANWLVEEAIAGETVAPKPVSGK